MRQRNDKYTTKQSNPQFNNSNLINTKSLLHKKMLFNDAVILPPHSFSCILSHRIVLHSTSNGYDSTGRRGTSNHATKICLVSLAIAKNKKNAILDEKEVNAFMKLIHGIEGDSNKVKTAPCKTKQPNPDVLKYIKGWKSPKAEVAKMYICR